MARSESVPLYLPELPLQRGTSAQTPAGKRTDASWIPLPTIGTDESQHFGRLNSDSNTDDLDLLTYLLESGSDRIGTLDFQASADRYVPRTDEHRAMLKDLLSAADRIQPGEELTPTLTEALRRGTSIGGARPKVLNEDGSHRLIAKFSTITAPYPAVKAEGIAMHLAVAAALTSQRRKSSRPESATFSSSNAQPSPTGGVPRPIA